MEYSDFVLEKAEVVFNKLGGVEGVMDFLSDKNMIVKVPSGEKISFNVWKTINLGTLKSSSKSRKVLKKNGFKIGDFGNEIFDDNFYFVSFSEYLMKETQKEKQLVNVSVFDLGFKDRVTYYDVCNYAKKLGLELCSEEVGPQLRLQYKDQPKGEFLHIAMKAFDDKIFCVEHDDNGLWLSGDYGNYDHFYSVYDRFIFCLRK